MGACFGKLLRLLKARKKSKEGDSSEDRGHSDSPMDEKQLIHDLQESVGSAVRDPLDDFLSGGQDKPPTEEEETYVRDGPLTLGQPAIVPGLDFDAPTGNAGASITPPDSLEREPRAPTPPSPPVVAAAAVFPPKEVAPPPPQAAPRQASPPPQPKPTSSSSSYKSSSGGSNKVLDLVYWRDVKKSGVVFGVGLVVLISLAVFSLISVLAYAGLILLALTLSFRVYKLAIGTIQKNEQGNPFKPYLEQDLHLPQDRVHEQVDVILQQAEDLAIKLRRLFLVEDMVETAKFGILLWALTYVGAWFSGMTLIILAFIGVFTIPKFYETYKDQIDQYYGIAEGHVKNVYSQVEEKVPFLKKKTQ